MLDKKFKEFRLSSEPHYFGVAVICKIRRDDESLRNNYYADIHFYTPFIRPVNIKDNQSRYLELISLNKQSNYWRDGVREISKEVFDKILSVSETDFMIYSDNDQCLDSALTSEIIEGGQKKVYTTTYERNTKLRQQAVENNLFSKP